MEKDFIVLLIVITLTVIVTIITLAASYKKERDQEFIYVHTKTGNRYRIVRECLMKIDGKWKDAIVYVSEVNGEMFVREYNDFTLNFKRLSEWKQTK